MQRRRRRRKGGAHAKSSVFLKYVAMYFAALGVTWYLKYHVEWSWPFVDEIAPLHAADNLLRGHR